MRSSFAAMEKGLSSGRHDETLTLHHGSISRFCGGVF